MENIKVHKPNILIQVELMLGAVLTYYIVNITVNPKDTNIFMSCLENLFYSTEYDHSYHRQCWPSYSPFWRYSSPDRHLPTFLPQSDAELEHKLNQIASDDDCTSVVNHRLNTALLPQSDTELKHELTQLPCDNDCTSVVKCRLDTTLLPHSDADLKCELTQLACDNNCTSMVNCRVTTSLLPQSNADPTHELAWLTCDEDSTSLIADSMAILMSGDNARNISDVLRDESQNGQRYWWCGKSWI